MAVFTNTALNGNKEIVMAYQNWPDNKKTAFKDWIKSENHRNAGMLHKDVNHIPNIGWTTGLEDRDVKDKFKKKTLRKIVSKSGIDANDDIDAINTKLVKLIKDENDNKKAETAFEAACFMCFYYMDSECIIDEVHENKKDVKVPVYGPSHKEQLNLPESPTIDDVNQAIAEIGA